MVRGALPLINLFFIDFLQKSLGWGLVNSAILTGILVMTIAIVSAWLTEETFHKDLDYLEAEEMLP
jgi:hypothetical protein